MFKIDLKDANNLILNFYNEFKETRFHKIGGIIDLNSFINIPFVQDKGTMCWFGLENQNELKLFFEPLGTYQEDDIPFYPLHEEVWEATFLLDFNMLPSNTKYPLNEIVFNIQGKEKDKIIARKDCLEMVAEFAWNFPKKNGTEKYNKYSLGFFETINYPEVIDFLDFTRIGYIAYFFGLDLNNPKYKGNNQIRIVLVGLDHSGNMLLPEKMDQIEEPYLLQYSWPPRNP